MQKILINSAAVIAGLFAVGAVDAQHRDSDRGGRDRVQCESRDFRYQSCPVDWRDAVLVRQTSSSQCTKGRTWGVDRRGLWVDRGCAGVFAEGGRRGRGDRHDNADWRPGADWDREIRFTCQSEGFDYRFCQVDVGPGGSVRLERQVSDTRCVEGRNWGWNRAGVWVNEGCAAYFRIERRWR
ncbi:MAG: DUF3011 domain-containing protein [Dokdonella sp.]